MTRPTPQDMSMEELQSRLQAIKRIHTTIIVIFAVIILAWLIPGLWRKNVPVFISTVAMSLGVSAALIASRRGLQAELDRRRRAT